MNYLTEKQILLIHSMIIDETGGSHGIRDHHAILSLVNASRQSVFGKELYPTLFLKAALYARDVIMNHPFMDGNKRTGVSVASIFLVHNGYRVIAQEGEIEQLALDIIKNKWSVGLIAEWFEKHSRKQRKEV